MRLGKKDFVIKKVLDPAVPASNSLKVWDWVGYTEIF